jgi:hypothetical protein
MMTHPPLTSFRRRRPLPLIGVTAAVLLYYGFVWGSLDGFVRAIDFHDQLFADFVIYYHEMAKTIFTSGTPAVGFYYPPAFALALGVLGFLQPAAAMSVWGGVLVAAMVGLAAASYRAAAPQFEVAVPFLFVFLTSFPLLHNFKWGQASLLLTLLVVGALLLLRRGRHLSAGALLACAVAIKYYPAMFLIPLVLRGRWSAIAAFAGSAAVLMLALPAGLLGWETTVEFYRHLAGESREVQMHAGGPNSQYLANVALRGLPVGREWIDTARLVFVAAGFLIAEAHVVLLFLIRRMEEKVFFAWAFVLLFLTIPFVLTTSWPHYLVYFPFCQLFLLSRVLERPHLAPGTQRLLSGILGVSILLSSVFAFQLMGTWEEYTGWGLLFWSNLLQLAATYVLLFPVLREQFSRPLPIPPA